MATKVEMSHVIVALLAVLVLLGSSVTSALAQPEYRSVEPTGGAASPDPCAAAGLDRPRTASTPPGFDARLPVPRGATSFTGVGSVVSGTPATAAPAPTGPTTPTGQLEQECARRR